MPIKLPIIADLINPNPKSLNDVKAQLRITQDALDEVIEINKEIKIKVAKDLAKDVAKVVTQNISESINEKVETMAIHIVEELIEKLPPDIAEKVVIGISKKEEKK